MQRSLNRVSALTLAAALLFALLSSPMATADDAAKKEAAPKPRGEKITIKLNMEKGAKRVFLYDMTMTTKINIPNQPPQDMNVSSGFVIATEVKDVDAETGDHTVSMLYERAKMAVAGGPISMKYDSGDKETANSPLGRALGPLIGKSVTATIAPNGRAKKIDGIDKLGNPALSGQLKQTFEQMFASLPPKPVDIGDSWSEKRKLPAGNGMTMNAEVKQTLWDRKDGNAIIKMEMTFDTEGPATMKGKMTGLLIVDEKTGWTESGNMTMIMDGEQRGMPMKANAKIKIDVKEPKAKKESE